MAAATSRGSGAEEVRGPPELVAPWNREGIPDKGPLSDNQSIAISVVMGILITIIYEQTTYFYLVPRIGAYVAIWIPLLVWTVRSLELSNRRKEAEAASATENVHDAIRRDLQEAIKED